MIKLLLLMIMIMIIKIMIIISMIIMILITSMILMAISRFPMFGDETWEKTPQHAVLSLEHHPGRHLC